MKVDEIGHTTWDNDSVSRYNPPKRQRAGWQRSRRLPSVPPLTASLSLSAAVPPFEFSWPLVATAVQVRAQEPEWKLSDEQVAALARLLAHGVVDIVEWCKAHPKEFFAILFVVGGLGLVWANNQSGY